ncbi:PepSY domain-containing protein [Oceanihabitans sp. 2_MG-2023]|uniref:PepSY domain-containing protein n=1 Tax=Oceanihabitans sp. 2_MG-2023 TaxID=3062661 RepID=UPI0026E332D7|nr:PepSY domain-containing protein [Oceanihabitans sp. 2_MG-2023]MDO6595713.1 PepSY domain-containing protein [Oceanihabitans sp. 2_MG-2023]
MTISIWRYSHLTLAVSSFIFILLASITGIILAFQPISEQVQPYKISDFESVTVAETLGLLKEKYPEVLDLQVDANAFVLASVITNDGESLNGYINPKTAAFLGDKIEVSPFFKWVTNFHRSLFLKSIGRFFVGLSSFLLFLIAVSGTVLILKRQGGLQKIFSAIINENFYQYWHVVLGRLTLIPILIITITGVYLSAEKFNVLPKQHLNHSVDFENLSEAPKQSISNFPVFKNTKLSEVKTIEFPFSEDVEDYFTISLKDKEMVVNQFTGEVLSEIDYPLATIFSNLSMFLHTGKGSVLWSVILAIATLNILFFIYSGFAMTLKRRKTTLKNKYKKDDAKYIILVGSENGNTLLFANQLQEQLLKAGETVYITELNKYTTFKKAAHIVVMTATYGEGEAPTNANRFLERLQTIKQEQKITFSVVGFGSLAYPNFCQFAIDVDVALQLQMQQELPVFSIHDKSLTAFEEWVNLWNRKRKLPIKILKEKLAIQPKQNVKLSVLEKTNVAIQPDQTFLIRLKVNTKKFASGDLLAIYPENNYRERLYSIGKVNNEVQLSVKLHENGLGSGFLNSVNTNSSFKARIIKNTGFHFPKNASKVLLIANGTGIAPFLGMLDQNNKKLETHLYYGVRKETSFYLYEKAIQAYLSEKKLSKLHLAFSQEIPKYYVQDFLKRDALFVSQSLKNNAIIMICGSLAMQKDVLEVLNTITTEQLNLPITDFVNQIKTDCY